jgi:hypothetical protein
MTRGRALLAAAACTTMLCLPGCSGNTLDREQLRARYVAELIDGGIDGATAECVIAEFVDPMSDAELREFNTEGDGLTDEQQATIAALADQCVSADA